MAKLLLGEDTYSLSVDGIAGTKVSELVEYGDALAFEVDGVYYMALVDIEEAENGEGEAVSLLPEWLYVVRGPMMDVEVVDTTEDTLDKPKSMPSLVVLGVMAEQVETILEVKQEVQEVKQGDGETITQEEKGEE